ncbi:MAG: oxygen-dependent coproporphyrinogen oxidase [Deltaproteobacteria bacterium]|nr:oxygen-dependent coproporphyrinogen oxidase [Deltaproteobacteria bacterium]
MSERAKRAHQFFLDLQDKITDALANADGGKSFQTEEWKRADGGGGRSRVLEDGAVIEKGGVNVSAVFGTLSETFGKDLPGTGAEFFATGISLIIHPKSPQVPTVHANFRYLERGQGQTAWYGGGADLTPWILRPEDARHFHQVWKTVAGRHPIVDHARLKQWCDEYFFLPHRQETRGIGGIFFDYLGLEGDPRGTPADLEQVERFVKDAGGSFLDAYLPIVERTKGLPWTEDERRWQLIRRGRYVEFNLLYDRGTIFGLKTGGRIESILVSLPNLVAWKYDHRPEPGYQTALVEALRQPRDWLA